MRFSFNRAPTEVNEVGGSSIWVSIWHISQISLNSSLHSLITSFDAQSNSLLTCIQVDDFTVDNIGDAPYNTWLKDVIATYSKNCSY